MYTNPSPSDLLEGVLVSLQNDILPNVSSQKAAVATVMVQALVQQVRQMIPNYLQTLALEHADMTMTMEDMATALEGVESPAAERVRARATEAANGPAFPIIPALDEVMAAHRALSTAMEENVRDLDALITAGHADAGEAALLRMRQHLGPRHLNDFATMVVSGAVGRG